MQLTKCNYLPDATFTYFEGEDLTLEYRNLGKGAGVILRCHKGKYQCYQIAFNDKHGVWSEIEQPVTLSASEVLDWFEVNYQRDFYHEP